MLLDFANHIAQRVDLFTPREWVFELVNHWLMKEERQRFFLLTGEPGSGKTAIAARLCQFSTGAAQVPNELQHLRADFLGAFHFCWARELRWINPLAFSSSLATQLANRFPQYQKALQTQRESRAIKSGRVSLNINQIVRQVINGQVIGVVINITGGSAQDAFIISVREPLAALQESGTLKQLVILVDALDEALLYDGPTSIVDLLSRSEELPPGVSFLLTSRPINSMLRRFRDAGVEEHSLSSGWGLKRSREDVKRHARRLLDEHSELMKKLSPSLSPESFVKSVGDKSKGNFLYVRYLLQMLEGQPARITRHSLDKLPTGLNRLYIEFLESHVGRGWLSRYAPIIGTLAVAQEPLTERQLSGLTGKKQTTV